MPNKEHFHNQEPNIPFEEANLENVAVPEDDDELARAAELKEQLTGGSEDIPPEFFNESTHTLDPKIEEEMEVHEENRTKEEHN